MVRRLVLVALFAAACERAPVNDAERLELAYRAAADEFAVPRPILEGIGWTETHWIMRAGVPANDNGFGTMHLADWGDDGPLARAARLLNVQAETLRTDRETNIRGAAALLRERADRYFAETPKLSEARLGDWWQVVMHYSNAEDADVADWYATQVFAAVNRGARGVLEDGSLYEMSPHLVDVSQEKLFDVAKSALTPEYGNDFKQARKYTAGRSGRTIDRVIIHTAQGSYAGTVSWFQNAQVQASAHYVVSKTGLVTQMVKHADTAWHAGNWDYNLRSVGIEHEGYVDQPSYLTEQMYAASAGITRFVCDTYGIPKDRQHVIGHNQVPDPDGSGWGGGGHHSDPCVTVDGRQCFWNWAHYMELVGGTNNPNPTHGTIQGTVYSSEGGCVHDGTRFQNCTKVVAGARVFLPETGATQLAGSDGTFSFDVAPGTYSPSGSASGFEDGGPVLGPRTVTSGGTAWSSFILHKLDSVAVVKGVVYAVNPQDGLDHSQVLEGATVSTSESNLGSTNAAGEFRLTVPSGDVTVTALKAGYRTKTATISIPAGTERVVEIGLTAGGEDNDAPKITFVRPLAGATLFANPVRVEGRVDEPVQGCQVGGKDAEVGADLKWVVNLDLVEGSNDIVATCADESNNVGNAHLVVTFSANATGVDGTLVDAEGGAPVSDAIVSEGELFTQSDPDGRFFLPLGGGSHALAVQAQGYQAKSAQVVVPEGGRVTSRIELVRTKAPSRIAITEPPESTTVETATIAVRGTVSISGLESVTVNGVTASVADGVFEAMVTLTPGPNQLVAVAKAGGRELIDTITVTYAAPPEDDGCGCRSGFEASLVGLAALFTRRVRRSVRR